jgi:hypothetical protein
MSLGPIKRKTRRFFFNVINFGFSRWHQYEHENWDLLDALLATYITQTGLKGIWRNATGYVAGDRAIDDDEALVYIAQADHTSSSDGTFAQERSTNPQLWRAVAYDPEFRGTWEAGTIYGQDDFVVYESKYAIVKQDHISTNFIDDVAAGYVHVLIDAGLPVAAAEAARIAAEESAVSASESVGLAQDILEQVQQVQVNVNAQDLSPYAMINGTRVYTGNQSFSANTNFGWTFGYGGKLYDLAGETRVRANSDAFAVTNEAENAYILQATMTSILYKGQAVWHSGNDGAGSGLDADTLDGMNTAPNAVGSTVMTRDSAGDTAVRLLNQTDIGNGANQRILWSSGRFHAQINNGSLTVMAADPTAGVFFNSMGYWSNDIVSDVRLGAGGVVTSAVGIVNLAPAGRVMYGVMLGSGAINIYYKALQKLLGGTWVTVSG